MKTHIIILAQGTQQRMVTTFPKQLLPLAGCAKESILGRTIRQLGAPAAAELVRGTARITLVTWSEIEQSLFPGRQAHTLIHFNAHPSWDMDVVTLPDPGNSSLKGIYRYLESQVVSAVAPRYDRTIVLLGDVVYSWACLDAIFGELAHNGGAAMTSRRFVGTSDIGPAGGELWGLAWMESDDDTMMFALESALQKHPPYADTYQPGQLRRWMWALHPSFQTTRSYIAIDDYTMDVDLPEQVSKLIPTSDLACADDAKHGMHW